MILYCLLEWPFNRNVDGLDPVWVSQPINNYEHSVVCAFPSILHAASVAVVVENRQAKIFKAPNSYSSWLNLNVSGFEKYISKSVNINSDVSEFLKGANPRNRVERVSICFEHVSDYVYSPSEELQDFIAHVSSLGCIAKGLEISQDSNSKQIEECGECNGEY